MFYKLFAGCAGAPRPQEKHKQGHASDTILLQAAPKTARDSQLQAGVTAIQKPSHALLLPTALVPSSLSPKVGTAGDQSGQWHAEGTLAAQCSTVTLASDQAQAQAPAAAEERKPDKSSEEMPKLHSLSAESGAAEAVLRVASTMEPRSFLALARAHSPHDAGINGAALYTNLLEHSPYFMTALAFDGSVVFQSPLSIRYYGHLSSSGMAASDCQGQPAGPLMPLLRKLFRLEGKLVMKEMLRTVLGQNPGRDTTSGWHRTMRVPATCALDEAAKEKLLHIGEQAKLRSDMQLQQCTASNTPPTTPTSLGTAGQDKRSDMTRPSDVCEAKQVLGQAAASSRPPIKSIGCVQPLRHRSVDLSSGSFRHRHLPVVSADQGDHELLERSYSGTSSLTESAAAVSVAARNAPKRMKSLLDMSMSSKFLRDASELSFTKASRPSTLTDSKSAAVGTTLVGSPPRAPHRAPMRQMQRVHSSPVNAMHASDLSPHRRAAVAAVTSLEHEGSPGNPKDTPSRMAMVGSLIPSHLVSRTHHGSFTRRQDSGSRWDNHAHPSESLSSSESIQLEAEGTDGPGLAQRLGVASLLPQPAAPCHAPQWGLAAEDVEQPAQGSTGQLEEREEWHELFVKAVRDEQDRQLLLIYQNDVTIRTQLETAMAHLTEMQLNTLCQIFPRHVIEFLSSASNDKDVPAPSNLGHLARSHEDVSILFMDIVGFTSMSKQVAPDAIMTFLNSLFSVFDDLCTSHNVHKVETAGDCYIVSSGMLSMDSEGFSQVAQDHDPEESIANVYAFAKDMLISSREVLMPHDSSPVIIRIGIHTGPCVSGVVGSKLPKFGVFGDTMNTASRMESTCTPGRIQISAFSHALLMASGDSCQEEWDAMGEIAIKGKGLMQTYQWREPAVDESHSHSQISKPRGLPEQGYLSQGAKLLQILKHPESQHSGRLSVRRPSLLTSLLPSQLEQVLEEESFNLPSASLPRQLAGALAKYEGPRADAQQQLQHLSMSSPKLLQLYSSIAAARPPPGSGSLKEAAA